MKFERYSHFLVYSVSVVNKTCINTFVILTKENVPKKILHSFNMLTKFHHQNTIPNFFNEKVLCFIVWSQNFKPSTCDWFKNYEVATLFPNNLSGCSSVITYLMVSIIYFITTWSILLNILPIIAIPNSL